MAGYSGFSMSNNAVEAYESGEKPLSKWTKKEIIDAIEEAVNTGEIELKADFSKIKELPLKALKEICLYQSSWHHTSKHFNKTKFYSLDLDEIAGLTNAKIDEILASPQEEAPQEERWRCAFIEWSGTRNHPKATRVVEEGIVKGNWFYRQDGSKKSVKANGFEFIEKVNG